ncbi:hypothetical protein AB0L88_38440, partial [Saccharopolyspora shandongensis]|uniref:hypothetical protein n=1 Tax=Saccharopolyspora shandongensis TaxID=418495 RepID=UPI003424BFFE
ADAPRGPTGVHSPGSPYDHQARVSTISVSFIGLRVVRGVGELLGEVLGEALLALAALALFAGVVAASAWGWQHSPAATVVLVAGIVLFLAFGAHELATRRAGQRKRRRPAAAAAGTVVFLLIWVLYLVVYLPLP